jgi:hypothetical protein
MTFNGRVPFSELRATRVVFFLICVCLSESKNLLPTTVKNLTLKGGMTEESLYRLSETITMTRRWVKELPNETD